MEMQLLKTTQKKTKLTSLLRTVKSANTNALLVITLICLPFFSFGKHNLANSNQPSTMHINVWHKNQRVAATFEFIELALAKVSLPHVFNVRTIEDNDAAYAALSQSDSKNRLDIMVAGVSIARETQFLPVYVPLDRGLLGFRVCIIAPQEQSRFNSVNQVSDFAQKALRVSLVDGWPDVQVMTENHIPVVTSSHYGQAVSAVESQEADCFSRSVIEVGKELQALPQLTEENHVALIYPFADIIYVNPNNPELHRQIQSGLYRALEDRSFHQLHDQHYQQLLVDHEFYARKLLIMENHNLTDAAHEAINRYGIASFSRLKKLK